MSVVPDASGPASPVARRRIVLAAIAVDDEAIEALEPRGGEIGTIPTPEGLRSTRLRFRTQAAWWATAATIGTGAGPERHGVLTALAIDPDGRGAHPRRESDADRPWIWSRFDRAGRDAIVCAWPMLMDLREPGVPAATAAAALAPKRCLDAASAPAHAAPSETFAAMLRPAEPALASAMAEAIRQAIAASGIADPHAGALRAVEAICVGAERLEAWNDQSATRRDGGSLRCLGMQLRADPGGTDPNGSEPNGAEPGEAEPGEAGDPAETDAGGDARRRVRGELLAATLARLCRDVGPDDVLLAAVFGDRTGRLWHRGLAIEVEHATAIDIVPTALAAADLPVPADLPGRPLQSGTAVPSKSWDLSGWGSAEDPSDDAEALVTAAERVRRARASLREAPTAEESASRLRMVVMRHLETQWSLALEGADWSAALLATEGLVEVRGAAIDLWRRAFAAERSGRREIVAEAIAGLRAEHSDDPATSLAVLLEGGPPSRDLIESIDLATLRIPTQRSVVGRAAARLGLDEIARKALAPLVAADRTIPADHMVLANLLLRLGEGPRALAALGGLGRGPSSPKRIRLLRAKCLAAADRRDDALALLDRLLVEAPFDTEARTLRERIAAAGG